MRLSDYLPDVRTFAYSPELAQAFTPTGAILLCWLIAEAREPGAEIEATVAEIMAETGLSEKNVDTAKERLLHRNVLSIRSQRLEHRTFYAISDHELLNRIAANQAML